MEQGELLRQRDDGISALTDGDLALVPTEGTEEQLDRAHRIAVRLQEFIEKGDLKPVVFKPGAKPHLWFEHWQFLGRFTGVTARIAWVRPVTDGFEARAEVVNEQTGVVVGAAESVCTVNENGRTNWDDFKLKGMAQTRACARALRQNLAWMAVLAGYNPTPAEEMEGQGANAKKPPREELAGIVRGMEDGAVSYLISVEWLPKGRTLADLDDKHVSACVKMSSKFIDAITKHMNKKAEPDTRRVDEVPESEVEELF